MKDELTTMMRASEDKHFSKSTRLTDLLLFGGGGGNLLSIWVNIYFSTPLRLLDNLILMQ